MVEIARAIAPSPIGDLTTLVMDEATSALSAREVDRLFAVIERLTARGVAIVYITHRLAEVHRIGQRVTVLRDGRTVSTRLLRDVTVDDLVQLMADRDVGAHYPRTRHGASAGAELLRAEHVSRRGVLHDISFTLHRGEVLGIGGLAGAGRSELARVLAGVDAAGSGRVFVDGQPIRFGDVAATIRHGIGLLPEDRKSDGLVGGFTAIRNITLPHGGCVAPLGVVSSHGEADLAEPILRDLRVKSTAFQPVRHLSGGNQQKVVLGKWLAGQARVFIFDEPTRGVDVGAKVEIYRLMNRLTASGAGILMISSDLPELLGMSDRILVMCRGRITADLPHGEATEARVLAAAFGMTVTGRA
jgi:ribose transport system ATP-binding protein